MKKILLFIFAQTILFSCAEKDTTLLDVSNFQNPPDKVKIHTWWHWLDGNITKEGITKDLEEMKAKGIVQATILNIGLFGDRDFGIKKTNFNSPEWFEIFQWALKEANRLGIAIGAHNCDGWSTSGGPWITPEKAMKQMIWTKTFVTSSDKNIKLSQPQAYHNFYKDVAVVAVKTNEKKQSLFQKQKPVSTFNDTVNADVLFDGCPVSGLLISNNKSFTYSFKEPFTTDKIAVHLRKSFMWANSNDIVSKFSVFTSDNGKVFKKAIDFEIKGLNKSEIINIPSCTAKFFKLVLNETSNADSWLPLYISEAELLNSDEKPLYNPNIPYLGAKSGDNKAPEEQIFYATASNNSENKTEVIDITAKMSAEGNLNWTAPEGNWMIFRFGYTVTGATNSPATKSGIGLECDKMDTSALNLHYKSFTSKLIKKAGLYTGNTFKFILIDSWESGFQNWTQNMPQEFEKRRGYSILKYVPLLCGENIGNIDENEAVLYDFRKTVADLIEDNYYKHFSDLLHKDKLELHAEVIYGNASYPPLDILKTTQYVDLPMYEYWSSTNDDLNVTYYPKSSIEFNMPSCAAIGYEKPVMASEAYTGMAHYCESPAGLKPFGDRGFCSGINQIILHSYVHQPNDNKPGMTLGPFGSHFNRNNNYWQFISEWFTFQASVQYILQQGVAQHDVLYYLGDQLPQFLVDNKSTKIPFGYMLNACNFDILKNKIEVKDGKLIINKKCTYAVLSLPPYNVMNFKTLKRIEELVNNGVIVYGPKPEKTLTLEDNTRNKKAFAELADKIWGKIDGKSVTENSYGKGKVYWGILFKEVFSKNHLEPDFSTGKPDSMNLLFLHKKVGTTDVYYVANQQNTILKREFTFRISGKTPQILNAEYGSIKEPAIYSVSETSTKIPVVLKPYESLFFVFSDKKPEKYISIVKKEGKQIFPLADNSELSDIPEINRVNNKFSGISGIEGDFEFITNNNKAIKVKSLNNTEMPITGFKGKIDFFPAYNAVISSVDITEFDWFTNTDKNDLKYFSGVAKYTVTFNVPADKLTADSILLNLGDFEAIAEVKLNGTTLGRLWRPGKLLNIKGVLKAENTLEISVANLFRNRFIGDFIEYGKIQNLWTSSPITDFLNKDRNIKPSGVKGPVSVVFLSKQSL